MSLPSISSNSNPTSIVPDAKIVDFLQILCSQDFDKLIKKDEKKKRKCFLDILSCYPEWANAIDPDSKSTYFTKVCQFGDLELAKVMFSNYNVDINYTSSEYEESVLHKACILGDINMIEWLISVGANIECRSKNGRTSLMLASLYGHVPVIELLISLGADVNAISKSGCTPLSLAASNSHVDAVEVLIKLGANINQLNEKQQNTLQVALLNFSSVDIIQLLIKSGTDVNHKDVDGDTALIFAVDKNDNIETISALTNDGVNINEVNNLGINALLQAVRKDCDIETLQLLLDLGLSIQSKDNDGENVLMKSTSFETIEFLVQAGANVMDRSKNGDNMLLYFLKKLVVDFFSEDVKTMELYINLGIDVNERDNEGQTALMILSSEFDDPVIEGVDRLIKAGANIDAKSNDGKTPLILACIHENYNLCARFIQAGADPNLYDNEGFSALLYTVQNNDKLATKLLISSGANANQSTNKHSRTPLSLAAMFGYFDIIEILIKAGADVMKVCYNLRYRFLHVLFTMLNRSANADGSSQGFKVDTMALAIHRNGHISVVPLSTAMSTQDHPITKLVNIIRWTMYIDPAAMQHPDEAGNAPLSLLSGRENVELKRYIQQECCSLWYHRKESLKFTNRRNEIEGKERTRRSIFSLNSNATVSSISTMLDKKDILNMAMQYL